MEFTLQIVRMLHEDHMAKLQFLDRLRGLITRQSTGDPPAADDHDFSALATTLTAEFSQTPDAHFALEEEKLFPLLAGAGEDEIGSLLTQEHREIEETAGNLLRAMKKFTNADTQTWPEFRRLAAALIGQLTDHIEKEEAALLPLLEETLSEDDDRDLTLVYAESR